MNKILSKLKVIISLAILLLISVRANEILSIQEGKSFLGTNANGINIYKIDLSLPPKERFNDVAAKYKDGVKSAIAHYEAYLPKWSVWLGEGLLNRIDLKLSDYYLEVAGMAEKMDIPKNTLLVV
jgi:hypothetical protein